MRKLRECFGTEEVSLTSPICKGCKSYMRCMKHIIHKGKGLRVKRGLKIFKVSEIALYTSKTK